MEIFAPWQSIKVSIGELAVTGTNGMKGNPKFNEVDTPGLATPSTPEAAPELVPLHAFVEFKITPGEPPITFEVKPLVKLIVTRPPPPPPPVP